MEILVKIIQSEPGKKLNIIKKLLPIIYTFDHEYPKVVITMRALKTDTYENIDIISYVNMEHILNYTELTLKGYVNTSFKAATSNCKENLSDDAIH